ncbi:alpha-glucosidase [Lachnospiraceae bacterium 29-91]
MMKKKWWHHAIGYQIYPKSFQDSNGDGIGDIKGIISRLDYLKDLGINMLWVCPVYRSPMVDHGYDISDYMDIDPSFGCNRDMDRLIAEAKKRGIGVLMDLVVNHTSDQHPWFQQALKDPDGKYGRYYIIKEGKDGGPPNNWRSIFQGSAWERIGETNQYYLHLFNKEQPDLNWENEELREEIYTMINQWLDRGLAGFRIDAISHLKKDWSYTDQPADGPDGLVDGRSYFRNVKGLDVYLSELKRRCFDPRDCLTIAEIDDVKSGELADYIGDDGYFSMIFDFSHTKYRIRNQEWTEQPLALLEELKARIFEKQEYAYGRGLLCTILENHDKPRVPDRLIPQECISFYSESLLAVTYLFLQGIPFLYQGQEIGMRDYPKTSIDEYKDAATHQNYRAFIERGMSEAQALAQINIDSREHSRTPMQWDSSRNAGFTSGTPWFDVNPNYTEINVELQEDDPASLLSFYRKILKVRAREDLQDVLIYGKTIPEYRRMPGIFAYRREFESRILLIISNCNCKKAALPMEYGKAECIVNNYEDFDWNGNQITLYPFQSIVFLISDR